MRRILSAASRGREDAPRGRGTDRPPRPPRRAVLRTRPLPPQSVPRIRLRPTSVTPVGRPPGRLPRPDRGSTRARHPAEMNLTRAEARTRPPAQGGVLRRAARPHHVRDGLPQRDGRAVRLRGARGRARSSTSPPSRCWRSSSTGCGSTRPPRSPAPGSRCPAWPPTTRCASSRNARTRAPARGCTGSPTRSTAPSTSTRSTSRATRCGSSSRFDQPDLKATFQLTVTAPADWQVVSNSPTPEPQPVSDGVARWGFAPTARISTYITALCRRPVLLGPR